MGFEKKKGWSDICLPEKTEQKKSSCYSISLLPYIIRLVNLLKGGRESCSFFKGFF